MKKMYQIFFVVAFVVISKKEFAQSNERTKLFRVYEDDDFFNISGHGTDESYTNGTRIDFFYEKNMSSGFFIDRLMPKVGDSARNAFGWSIMQVMVTPNNISSTKYQPDDYAYAGALYLTHSVYSYDPIRKYDLETELLAGVRGPASFARQMQTAAHSLVRYQEPMGWKHQLSAMQLVNVNFTAEKQFASIESFFELNGGSILRVGTLTDAISIYPMIRIGKMSPYFDGYLNQFGSYKKNGKAIKTQYYFVFKPTLNLVARNAIFSGKPENEDEEASVKRTVPGAENDIQHYLPEAQFGVVFARESFAFSYMQTYSGSYRRGLYKHSFGNLSLYVRW